jgi:LmbE family N-acetylglucosaminyl deacetylase
MGEALKLLCVLAHPDDESLGLGGTLVHYAAQGVQTYVVTATRGERGWTGPQRDYPGERELARTREAELRAAAEVLGLREVTFLDYLGGELDQADPLEAVEKITGHLRRIRPEVVVTFGPDGAYGHPDHIAICQLTTAAVLCAADAKYKGAIDRDPHRVAKLYYLVDTKDYVARLSEVVGEIGMRVDGVRRQLVGWEDWVVSARIDVSAHWRTVWRAILCHESQLATLGRVFDMPEEILRDLLRCNTYYRAMSLVNAGRQVENDLLCGLR